MPLSQSSDLQQYETYRIIEGRGSGEVGQCTIVFIPDGETELHGMIRTPTGEYQTPWHFLESASAPALTQEG